MNDLRQCDRQLRPELKIQLHTTLSSCEGLTGSRATAERQGRASFQAAENCTELPRNLGSERLTQHVNLPANFRSLNHVCNVYDATTSLPPIPRALPNKAAAMSCAQPFCETLISLDLAIVLVDSVARALYSTSSFPDVAFFLWIWPPKKILLRIGKWRFLLGIFLVAILRAMP